MKITSNAQANFWIGDVFIKGGTHNYNIDYKKRNVAYVLATMQREGIIAFDEVIELAPDVLPFEDLKEAINDNADKPNKAVKKTRKRKARN